MGNFPLSFLTTTAPWDKYLQTATPPAFATAPTQRPLHKTTIHTTQTFRPTTQPLCPPRSPPLNHMDLETFTLLPLHLDPTSKALSCPTHASAHINSELTELNTLHRLLLNITDSPIGTNIPPPPIPLNPKRGAQIAKMREQANTLMRRGRRDDAEEAVKLYTYALTMSSTRPPYEPHQNTLAELSQLYANRAQAHMTLQAWPEGAADASTSVELKRAGNGKAWWRRGRCLIEMGRWREAGEWVERWREMGEEAEGGQGLEELGREVEAYERRAGGR